MYQSAVRIDVFRVRYGVGNRHRDDVFAAQRDHLPEVAGQHQVGGRGSEARGQHAVEGDRRAAALDVPEHGDADLELDLLRDVGGHLVGDAAEAARSLVEVDLLTADALRSLRDDDDVELR